MGSACLSIVLSCWLYLILHRGYVPGKLGSGGVDVIKKPTKKEDFIKKPDSDDVTTKPGSDDVTTKPDSDEVTETSTPDFDVTILVLEPETSTTTGPPADPDKPDGGNLGTTIT